MNPLQMAQQIKHELETVAWVDGSGDVVFGSRGSVVVFPGGPPSEEALPPGFPFALVTIDGGSPDEAHPDLIEQNFTVIVAAHVQGDPLGEHAVIGGARTDIGKSANAGVAEVAERVRAAVENLTGVDGATILLSGSGTGSPATLGRNKQLAFDEFQLTAWCTSRPQFAAPQQLQESGDTWTWEGSHCSERFDFYRYRLGYKIGTTPAETPADITAFVYSGSNATTTVPPVAGRIYSVFADYNPRGALAAAHSSLGNVTGAYLAK